MNRRQLLARLAAGSAASFAAHAESSLRAYAEVWPPYCYQEGERSTGYAVELLREMAGLAELGLSIELLPWKRALRYAEQERDALIFPTARNPEREPRFHWIGPLAPRQLWLYGRPGSRPPQLELIQGRIATVRGDAAIDELLSSGVPPRLLDPSTDIGHAVQKFLAGRVDYFYDTELSAAWQLRQAGQAAAAHKLLMLSDGGAYYYALNAGAAPALAARLQQALERLRAEGRVKALLQRFGGA
ncbi:transporter substrate-binding domain-containing protein [Paucibacter sediminis]|uniref:Transporter substrate-binding domain-containing protein n=1 Tax=Paucibacter sediminis TaxID=3019553 RepID=A0AA95NJJ1_9BURK|nr:transporter substrate-binding domain-containing protein [Paucibacter sp. S2-9]WIT13769.1 transporter substrate-binding domain-containing protein [Paucibacter sp. S2-9]